MRRGVQKACDVGRGSASRGRKAGAIATLLVVALACAPVTAAEESTTCEAKHAVYEMHGPKDVVVTLRLRDPLALTVLSQVGGRKVWEFDLSYSSTEGPSRALLSMPPSDWFKTEVTALSYKPEIIFINKDGSSAWVQSASDPAPWLIVLGGIASFTYALNEDDAGFSHLADHFGVKMVIIPDGPYVFKRCEQSSKPPGPSPGSTEPSEAIPVAPQTVAPERLPPRYQQGVGTPPTVPGYRSEWNPNGGVDLFEIEPRAPPVIEFPKVTPSDGSDLPSFMFEGSSTGTMGNRF